MKHISTKILLLAVVSVLVVGAVSIGLAIGSMYSIQDSTIKEYEATLRSSYDELFKSQIQQVLSMLKQLVAEEEAGTLAEGQARQLGASLLRQLRYKNDDYFWADTSQGDNVVLLGRDVEGTNRWDLQDANGTHMVQEMNRQALAGGGFVDYWFPRASGGGSPAQAGLCRPFCAL